MRRRCFGLLPLLEKTKAMKIFIAHRGNTNGPNPAKENAPDYILQALGDGFDVEVDVWYRGGWFYLGHDQPQHVIDKSFLFHPRLWIHCKNTEAMFQLCGELNLNVFAHTDGIAITRNGYLWTAPDGDITNKSIAVMPEVTDEDWNIDEAVGVCSDYVEFYRLK
jgi:hypothetical protein